MTKKKKNLTTPASSSKRKSQTLSLDEFLSPVGENMLREIDHHHTEEEPPRDGHGRTVDSVSIDQKEPKVEEIVTLQADSSLELEPTETGRQVKIGSVETSQEPNLDNSEIKQCTNGDTNSTIVQHVVEKAVLEEIEPNEEIDERGEMANLTATNAEEESTRFKETKETNQSMEPLSNATLVNHKIKAGEETNGKQSRKKSANTEQSAIAKRVLDKLNITPEIRKASTKDMSHITKMTLITQEPTNSNICSVFVYLDTPISHEELRTRLDKRVVQKYPRFRSTVSSDYTTFCEQENMDIEQHIRYVRVPKSSNRDYSESEEVELTRELLGKLIHEPFDFARPLWECIVIDNCPSMGYLLLFRIHHAIGDGASLVMFFSQFCDQGEEHFKSELIERKEKLISKTIRTLEHVPLIGFFIRMLALAWFLFGIVMVVVKWTYMILSGSDKSLFKTPVSTEKHVSWTKPFDIADIKLVGKNISNATVNDIVLNSLSGALMRYTERRTNDDSNKKVTLSVPVNLRLQEEEFNGLSNKFGFMLVPLNLKKLSKNPESRLSQIKTLMDRNKNLPEPFFTYQVCKLVNILPPSYVGTLYKYVSKWVTAVFTNLQGSTTQLTVDGVKVNDLVAFAPSPSGLSFAISSHNGKLVLGVCADTLTANPKELVKDFENDLDHVISMAKYSTH